MIYTPTLMILICAQLSTLMCLVLEVNEGASATLESSAAEQLKLDTATQLQEQCKSLASRSIRTRS